MVVLTQDNNKLIVLIKVEFNRKFKLNITFLQQEASSILKNLKLDSQCPNYLKNLFSLSKHHLENLFKLPKQLFLLITRKQCLLSKNFSILDII